MEEEQISKVAAVLAEWNPLRSRADSVSDLDGYRIEAIDIIMALGVFRRFVAPEKTVSDILNQAFDLSLKPIDCVAPARKIQLILGSDQCEHRNRGSSAPYLYANSPAHLNEHGATTVGWHSPRRVPWS